MKKLKVLYLTLAVVILDQITKLVVKGFSFPILGLKMEGLNLGERHDVIGSFFRITFVENPGMAFGIDFGISSKLFLSVFSIFASFGIVYYLYKVREDGKMLKISLALILGGAVGNLIDRVFYGVFYGYAPLFYGKVVDFIDLDFFDINFLGLSYDRWPIFNIADMSVSIGVILLILFSKSKEETKQTDGQEQIINANSETAPTDVTIKNVYNTDNDKPDNSKEIQN